MTTSYRDMTPHAFGRIFQAGEVDSWGPTPTFKGFIVEGGYSIVYVYRGGGIFRRDDGFEQPIVAGDMILIFPKYKHSYGGGAEIWTELSIWFDGPVFQHWQRMGFLNPARPVWHLEPIEYWLRRFKDIFAQPQWPGPSSALTRCSHLLYVLADAFQHEDLEANGLESQRWLRDACEHIDRMASGGTIEWKKLTALFQMTPEGFRRKFTRLAKISPTRYHRQAAMQHASQLLHDSQLSIGQISEAAGFCDQFHFSHQFKKLMGVSPSEFRRRLFG